MDQVAVYQVPLRVFPITPLNCHSIDTTAMLKMDNGPGRGREFRDATTSPGIR